MSLTQVFLFLLCSIILFLVRAPGFTMNNQGIESLNGDVKGTATNFKLLLMFEAADDMCEWMHDESSRRDENDNNYKPFHEVCSILRSSYAHLP